MVNDLHHTVCSVVEEYNDREFSGLPRRLIFPRTEVGQGVSVLLFYLLLCIERERITIHAIERSAEHMVMFISVSIPRGSRQYLPCRYATLSEPYLQVTLYGLVGSHLYIEVDLLCLGIEGYAVALKAEFTLGCTCIRLATAAGHVLYACTAPRSMLPMG